jgi:hypothetical protein
VVKDYCGQIKHTWENTSSTWGEEEVHYEAKNYDEFITKRKGKPIGRILDVENVREEAQRRDKEEETTKSSAKTTSTHFGLAEEENQWFTRREYKRKRFIKRKRTPLKRK